MEISTSSFGSYGYSWRPYGALYPDCPSRQCAAPIKPSSGKSFTIDAILGKPEQPANEQTNPLRSGGHPSAASPLALPGQMCSPLAHYVYTPHIVHSQPGYPAYCSPLQYQAFRGGLYPQGIHVILIILSLFTSLGMLPHYCSLTDYHHLYKLDDFLFSPQKLHQRTACSPLSTEEGSRKGCAPALPTSSSPVWRRSSPVSSTWWDRKDSF